MAKGFFRGHAKVRGDWVTASWLKSDLYSSFCFWLGYFCLVELLECGFCCSTENSTELSTEKEHIFLTTTGNEGKEKTLWDMALESVCSCESYNMGGFYYSILFENSTYIYSRQHPSHRLFPHHKKLTHYANILHDNVKYFPWLAMASEIFPNTWWVFSICWKRSRSVS